MNRLLDDVDGAASGRQLVKRGGHARTHGALSGAVAEVS
jgi:hypothetical protein